MGMNFLSGLPKFLDQVSDLLHLSPTITQRANGQVNCHDAIICGCGAKQALQLNDIERLAGSDFGKGRSGWEFRDLAIHANFQHAVLLDFDLPWSREQVKAKETQDQKND